MGKVNKRRIAGSIKSSQRINDPELISLMSLVEASRYVEIERAARRILAKRRSPFALKALSFSLIGQEHFEDALPVLEAVLQSSPADAEVHLNCGIAFSALMRWDEAVRSYQLAIELDPDSLQAHSCLGIVYSKMHRWNDAVAPLLKAIELSPDDNVGAIETLADCLVNAGRVEESWTCYRELVQNNDKSMHSLYQWIWTGLQCCQWDGLANQIAALREGTNGFSTDLDNPFGSLAFPGLTSADHFAVARSYASRLAIAAELPVSSPPATSSSSSGKRLRVAYMSSDFRSHAVGFVLPRIIEGHDRSVVEVYGYSTKAEEGSLLRRRLTEAFENFVDVSDDSADELRRRIRSDNIDILVNLNGWTSGNRNEVFASRCAPVQVNWLGYPGTMGHPGLADYIVGDPFVTPEAYANCYSELIAQLPHCYLPSDTARTLHATPSREEALLPEGKFVFCSLNNSYKLNPELFDVWCEILRAAPDSVLWLAHPGDAAAARLLQQAEARGVVGTRLIFAPRVASNSEHLARIPLADMALDTFPYNSHSSGTDALWFGVPMITRMGETFASRVGASMLTACGLPELVTQSFDDYKALALSMYDDRNKLTAMRSRLASRKQSPLFDMPGFVLALEGLFQQMWNQHQSGMKLPIYSKS